jgi:cholest-4-en-3-one 26-monooxygenase
MSETRALEDLAIVDPDDYAAHGYPQQAWARLRREAPVFRFERGAPIPFWALTAHREIVEVSRRPESFANGPRTEIVAAADAPQVHGLITMDPPEHGRFRKLVSPLFTSRALGPLRRQIEEVADAVLDAVAQRGLEGECDFVAAVAEPFPVAVIAWMLGVPREDWPDVRRWTNEVVGALDPEFHRGEESAELTQARAVREMLAYLGDLLKQRRARPQDDLLSFLARTEQDGAPVPDEELLAFAVLLMIAGNETTRNATSGGLLAFLEHPAEWERLRRDPSLLPSAVEEILRWTSPVVHFARTATRDVELRDQKIRAGDALALFYASANRDEEVHAAPFEFRIDRRPNRHLAFGVGEHVCLGAHVARLELRVIIAQLRCRLAHAELVGPVERLRSATVGGVKRMPIRYRLNPR